MRDTNVVDLERSIAECRVILSVTAFLTVYVDPTTPSLTRWLPLTGGPFTLDPYALGVMLSHLTYSVTVYFLTATGQVAPRRIAVVSTWADVVFGAAVALVTEGTNSPFSIFFAFAVLAAGLRASYRLTAAVTLTSVALYLGLIVLSRPEHLGFYVMRPAYIAITGYLVRFFGRQRLLLEARLHELEAATQRERIARSLHDGYVQALAAVNLRVETCRELLRRGRGEEAFGELTELQTGVTREYDELRRYIRSLLGLETGPAPLPPAGETSFAIRAEFEATLPLVEHALQIMVEGARNVGRHAYARSAVISARPDGAKVVITIDDDGVGFPTGAAPPWSVASRAAELGGQVRIGGNGGSGGHVVVELPER